MGAYDDPPSKDEENKTLGFDVNPDKDVVEENNDDEFERDKKLVVLLIIESSCACYCSCSSSRMSDRRVGAEEMTS